MAVICNNVYKDTCQCAEEEPQHLGLESHPADTNTAQYPYTQAHDNQPSRVNMERFTNARATA